MGDGYSVLVWDAFGCGLHRINPRLIELSDDNRNWIPCEKGLSDELIDSVHGLTASYGDNWQVIR